MNTSCRAGAELAVTGVGIVSPWGDTPEAADDARGAAVPGTYEWFDHRARLGPRGYRYLPPAAQYALAAARTALDDGGRPQAVPADRRALLLATNAGPAELLDAMDGVVLAEGAAGISPASAPYFAVNVLGNRLAAELSLTGFALTVATARTAALDALSAGALALAAGRCDSLVLAAVEEPPPARAAAGPGRPGEQGAGVFTLESVAGARARGAAVTATLRARSLFLPPTALDRAEGRARAGQVLTDALAALLVPPEGDAAPGGSAPPLLRLDLDDSPVSEAVAVAVAGLGASVTEADDAGGAGRAVHPGRRTGCLGPALAVARAVTARDTRRRLVVCASGAGHVALVRASPGPSHHSQESEHAEVA
ncbi:beta-ketoacyl synthase N-terminal-like domain-containing protein [Streptomyces sp. WAC 04229]|uniref:beta-ketoacyl synthase N-terminal-like domain-containing protein n=1 Tax=Streptomyces sp. WAC 04229 TaxID=2203206 RepID=UPI003D70AB28